MGSTTGIELGPDFCVLVAVRPRRAGSTDVLAIHCIERSEWPLRDTGVTEALRAARTTKKFPRKARLVVWGLPEGATRDDPVAAAILRPVIAAGFRADAILTPAQALAALAASRRPGASGAAAWLAVNVHGAAIAIVRGHELLFARTLEWSYKPFIAGSRAQLLQRYSLVAQLAPEIRHGIGAVMSTHGETVGTVITCGDLPELRSLTMPLIEELDLEVETLDSAEGLKAVGKAKMERFTESAPAIRLACAAAIPVAASNRRRPVAWMPVAAGIASAAIAGWAVLAYTNRDPGTARQVAARTAPVVSPGRGNSAVASTPVRPAVVAPESRPGSPFATAPTSESHPAPVTQKIPAPSAVTSASNTPVATPRSTGGSPLPPPAVPGTSSGSASKTSPVTLPPPAAPGTVSPSSSKPAAPLRPPAAPGTPSALPSKPAPTAPPLAASSTPSASSSKPAPLAAREPVPAPKVVPPPSKVAAAPPQTPREPLTPEPVPPESAERAAGKRAVPLKEPLPRLDSILVDQDRRLAVIDGVVVHAGDSVGARVVAHIARDGVLLREPSGLVVRLPLR